MRYAARVDANHDEIVQALRDVGCSVESLAAVGRGVPDLLVGLHGRTYLLEVKTAKGGMTEAQVRWHSTWRGAAVTVVRSVEGALLWHAAVAVAARVKSA